MVWPSAWNAIVVAVNKMPVLKVKHVVSFSSEDENHPADNIIKPETYYKWRCATAGEMNATIVLQLEKASQLSGVDIGNNGAAFIEVLVGRSSWSQSEEFQVHVFFIRTQLIRTQGLATHKIKNKLRTQRL